MRNKFNISNGYKLHLNIKLHTCTDKLIFYRTSVKFPSFNATCSSDCEIIYKKY